ncbi:Fc.00g056910.m01.CDS01 [Cosmosporella sp. VM-42]
METRRSTFRLSLAILLVSVVGAYLSVRTLRRTIVVAGLFRTPANSVPNPSPDVVTIEGTTHCEDLHYHEASKLLFTACEESEVTRYSWFPPLGNFDDSLTVLRSQGSIKIISPTTLQVRRLRFENFDKKFITHGIDVMDDPSEPRGQAVYIFAVNHPPNDDYYSGKSPNSQKSRSVVEIFHHVIGTDTIRHVRTVWHPLITTPNDVLGLSPTSFFVTNDHYYRHGIMRLVEDIYFGATWSNTIYIEAPTSKGLSLGNDSDKVKASVALQKMHNNNGIGRGRTPEEVLIASCTSGVLHLATQSTNSATRDRPASIAVLESIRLDSIIDNPSYFTDPYKNQTFDASGFIVCGSSRAIEVPGNIRDPDAKDGIMVWKVTSKSTDGDQGGAGGWTNTLIFEDKGDRIRSASTAVLVSLKPSEDTGHRRARLFVTGYLSSNMIAVDIDL